MKGTKLKKRLLAGSIVVALLAGLAVSYGIGTRLNASEKGALYGESALSPREERTFRPTETAPAGMKLVSEDGGLQLFVDEKQAFVAVLDTSTGEYWYSNPPDAAQDTLAYGDQMNRLQSQVYLEYYNANHEVKNMDSYFYSVKEEGFALVPIANGVRVEFTIGKKQFVKEMLPQVVDVATFESDILANISDQEQLAMVKKRYKQVVLSEQDSYKYEEFKTAFPELNDNTPYYILNLYTPEYEYEDLYNAIFNQAGYTVTQLEEENARHGIAVDIPQTEQFFVPVEYTLRNGELVVTIPMSAVRAPEGLYIKELTLLEYFGAANQADEGYLLLPDGSGSLINFNNGKTQAPPFKAQIYGADTSQKQEDATLNIAKANLPVFGVKKNRYGFYAVMEEGEAHASVYARVAGMATSYNHAYAAYTVLPVDFMTIVSNENRIVTNKYQQSMYQGNIRTAYCFTEEKDSDYSGFARLYRQRLVDSGVLHWQPEAQIPFLTELVGKVETEEDFLGVPYTAYQTLTSFEQAEAILEQMQTKGITAADIQYTAWFSGLSRQNFDSNSGFASGMGGRTALDNLQKRLTDNGGRLYLGTAIQRSFQPILRFNYGLYGTRYTYNEVVNIRPFNVATGLADTKEKNWHLLSTRYLSDYVRKIDKRMQQKGAQAIWLEDMGNLLFSDFSKNANVDRQIAIQHIQQAAAEFGDKPLGVRDPNLYLLSQTALACDVPLEATGQRLQDESVPFLPMVLSGCVRFTGSKINLSGKAQEEMLRAVQTGSGLYFKWIYADNVQIREYEGREPQKLYSLYYGEWLEQAAAFYTRMQREMNAFAGKPILQSERLDEGVYRTTWENGSVIVNYRNASYFWGERTIPAKDYTVVMKEGL